MGACYSVKVEMKIRDEVGVVKALNEHIFKDTRTNYSLEKYAQRGITPDTLDGLMKIMLAGLQHDVCVSRDEEAVSYSNEFNASYGWERVMMEWFEVMTPFLRDGSSMLIYPDSDYDKLVVMDGKCVQVH